MNKPARFLCPIAAGVIGGAIIAATLVASAATSDPASAPVSAPTAQPVAITGAPHVDPALVPAAVSPAPVTTPAVAPRPPVVHKAATPKPTKATTPAHSVQKHQTYTVYCDNGYLHADGSCSSTPTEPVFTPPTEGGPCSGTASQCLDSMGGQCNEISSLLGSGTPGCVDGINP